MTQSTTHCAEGSYASVQISQSHILPTTEPFATSTKSSLGWRMHAYAVARVAASIVLLGLVLWWIDWRQVLDVMRGASSAVLLLVLALFYFERCFSAYRWHVLIQTQTRNVQYSTTLKVTFLSTFLGNFLPGAIGMEAVRVGGLARTTADLAGALSTVVVDRVLGFAALVLILSFVLPFAPVAATPILISILSLIVLTAAGFVLLPLVAYSGRNAEERSWRIWRLVQSKLRKLHNALRAMRNWPRTMAWAMVLAVLFQFVRVIMAPLIAFAIGLHIPFLYFVLYVPIIVFLTMLPFTVGGLGVREAAFVFFFGSGLTTPEGAFAISIIIYIMGLMSSLPGAAILAVGLRKEVKHLP